MNKKEYYYIQTPVKFEDLIYGMFVEDEKGNLGYVRDCKDMHNIHIEGLDSSFLYCIDETCADYEKLYTFYIEE